MFAVYNKFTLLSHWLAYDDLGRERCYRVTKMCEMTHLHSTRRVFNTRRHLRTQKASKPLAAGGPHWGSCHRSSVPLAGPTQTPPPISALRASEDPPNYC